MFPVFVGFVFVSDFGLDLKFGFWVGWWYLRGVRMGLGFGFVVA